MLTHAGDTFFALTVLLAEILDLALFGLHQLLGDLLVSGQGMVEGSSCPGVRRDRMVLP